MAVRVMITRYQYTARVNFDFGLRILDCGFCPPASLRAGIAKVLVGFSWF
jgi:hypothetical protein